MFHLSNFSCWSKFTHFGMNGMSSWIYLGDTIYHFLADIPTLVRFKNSPHHDKREWIFSVCDRKIRKKKRMRVIENLISSPEECCFFFFSHLHHSNQVFWQQLWRYRPTLRPNYVECYLQLRRQLQQRISLLVEDQQCGPRKDLRMSTCSRNYIKGSSQLMNMSKIITISSIKKDENIGFTVKNMLSDKEKIWLERNIPD